MSTPQSITSEIQKLDAGAIIELFVLDATPLGGSLMRFHAGTNHLNGNVVWQGNTYIRFPVEASGFEYNGSGQLPRPKIRVSNYLSAITALLLSYQDLLGTKIIRKRTLKKYLDAVNFVGGVNPTADNTAEFPEEIFYIDRKTNENREAVEFELAVSFDVAGIALPRRQIIQNVCSWRYRGPECGYAGTNYFTAADKATSDPALDVCGKRLTSCQCRFGTSNTLPFGGFPAAGLFR